MAYAALRQRAPGECGEAALADRLARLAQDLHTPALAALQDWRQFNFDRLKRTTQEGLPVRKPRATITMEINQSGNLTIRWYPRGYPKEQVKWNLEGRDYDYLQFDASQYEGHRPAHELLWLKDAGALQPFSELPVQLVDVDEGRELLVCALKAVVDQLIATVERHAMVLLRDRLEIDILNDGRWDRPVSRASRWRLARVFDGNLDREFGPVPE